MAKKSDSDNSILVTPAQKDFAIREGKIRECLKYGIEAKGRALFLKTLRQGRTTASQAIVGKCYDCMGWYADGKGDCRDPLCPLYPWMPYGAIVHAHRHLRAKKSDALVCSQPPISENDQKEAGEP